MLQHARLDKLFWFDAVATAVHVKNRCPNAALGYKTPAEQFNGSKPDVSHFRLFGCDACVLLEDGSQTKLDSKVKKGVVTGFLYDNGVKGYRINDQGTGRIVVSRNVQFNETSMCATNAHGTGEDETRRWCYLRKTLKMASCKSVRIQYRDKWEH
eukprot:ANDGO_06827.mRNA.1 Copia protein